jgi:hypothetical protein
MEEDMDLDGDGKLNAQELKIANDRWKARRLMAWKALYGIFIGLVIFVVLIAFTEVSEPKLKFLSEMMGWYFFSCTSIIGAYMGFSTYSAKK